MYLCIMRLGFKNVQLEELIERCGRLKTIGAGFFVELRARQALQKAYILALRDFIERESTLVWILKKQINRRFS